MINVTIFNEFIHEQDPEHPSVEIYPDGIHNAIRGFLENDEIKVRTCTLDDLECGLTQEVLDNTDVLIWWSHIAHDKVPDEVAERVHDAVLRGMGAIFLHSSHLCKPFLRLVGTSGTLNCHESDATNRLWVISPSSRIAEGLGDYIDIPADETYIEPFDVPEPDRLVFVSWFSSGEVFRSGCCYNRGLGRIFYFQPGHETYPVYYQPEVQTIIRNAVRWAKPIRRIDKLTCVYVAPIEK